MKKLLLSLAVVLCGATTPERTVYVCVSPTAYAYHLDKKCKALGKCAHEIKAEPESTAKADHRRLCKVCGR